MATKLIRDDANCKEINQCYWAKIDDEMMDYWQTSCENAFAFEDGTPIDNGFNFCPYCGCLLMLADKAIY